MKKYNMFPYTHSGQNFHSKICFWGEKIEFNNDDSFDELASEYVEKQDETYGCWYMDREDCELLIKQLQELLEVEDE